MNPATARSIKLLALDVDGVLTDGRITYGNDGEELKSFNIKDGLGIKLLQGAGVEVAIITGRQSHIVDRRARELGIETIIQGREDKLSALKELSEARRLKLSECAYMGDDLPDLGAVRAAGLGLTVADASDALLKAADWQSKQPGGHGAVREACETLLSARGQLHAAEAAFE
ncbi:KdsC family phosphatase [Congregibacter litoralis]|uniref:3-deoxy-D-manno-octulosonate 8-phosphate phosphatase KdsC n=1 Tax=Congregibacter litoralis KT71 TaxID=314285 RepID=A4A5C8_9GAMM|nr:HAD-IIIA family hydrolase [Congregibacter litoralis]EAQ98999.1 3-deoxy-D-manno-octulosonate 8-phosphate phosphatase, YrbI family [Congregibacter litoralis KT71]